MKRLIISDCEGPISKNDNAFEATSHFVPKGDRLFAIISKYDDVLAEILKRKGYNAGDTLKLILPFLKAHDVTDEALTRFSAENLVLISGSKQTMSHINSQCNAFIVSTSYEHYIRALCEELDFPFENTYCTRLNLNKYVLTDRERLRLIDLASEVALYPMIRIPASAKSFEDFSKQDQETIMKLDDIFWEEICRMGAGIIFRLVKPIGGQQKAEAVLDAVEKTNVELSDVLYVGDSITDVEAFKLVKENGGLTISFNGNEYAVRNAEVAVLANNNTVTSAIAELFLKLEKNKLLSLIEDWSLKTLKQTSIDKAVLERLAILGSDDLPKIQIVTPQNMEILVHKSSEFRKQVRGEAIGKLG